MTHYVGIIDGQKDVWGVRIPDVPGCHGGGGTPEQALSDAVSALSEIADDLARRGRSLPAARTISECASDPAIRKDMSETDAFVLVPLIFESGRPARANISMDAGLLQAIDSAAKRRGLTRSAFLASAAREKILSEV
ncbi:type II toxin-antitoxin system HicB family antitoxin [Prosthecomicrobium sp. N25]|uniref:type II toxin-antitoxin system HicB family antitoxin n=1 Tax=Prosthecomicrobium sp. N25 TaxID=3129254 RepID=UPI0030775B8B